MARRAGNVGGIVQRDRWHGPRYVADIVAAGAARCRRGLLRCAQRRYLRAKPTVRLTHHPLHRLRHVLIISVPRRHADAHCVAMHGFRNRFVEVRTPRRADDLNCIECCERCRSGGARHDFRVLEHLRDFCNVALAKIEPHRGRRRHHIRLIPAVGDHVVRSLRQFHVLAMKLPRVTHRHDRVERTASTPRRAGGMRRLTAELEQCGDESERRFIAPRHTKLAAHVREQIRVDPVEDAGAHQKRFAGELLLGHTRPEHDRARNLVAGHDVLHRQRGDDVERDAAVVPFTMSRRAADQWVTYRRSGLLVGLRNAVDI